MSQLVSQYCFTFPTVNQCLSSSTETNLDITSSIVVQYRVYWDFFGCMGDRRKVGRYRNTMFIYSCFLLFIFSRTNTQKKVRMSKEKVSKLTNKLYFVSYKFRVEQNFVLHHQSFLNWFDGNTYYTLSNQNHYFKN